MLRFFGNKVGASCDDLIQETFLACVRSKESYRGDASFRSFLFGIAHNVLRSFIRSRAREHSRLDWTETSAAAIDPSPSSIAARSDEQRAVLAALRQIPLVYQIALELYYWEDVSATEIGRLLDLPEGTVRSRLRRGKELIARALLVANVTDDTVALTMRQLGPIAGHAAENHSPSN